MLHRREGLHLCEHDSTVWVHFYLLELMVRWICASSSCICRSEREEKRRASLLMSRLTISVTLGIMLRM